MSENGVNSSSDPVGSETLKIKLLLPSETYTFHFPYKQHFPFPFDVIKYIIKNPKSSYGLLKLYKTCKHFYSKKQVLIIFGKITFYPNEAICNFQAENKKDFTDIKKDTQIWFENDLFIDNESLYYFTKLYRCTVKFLAINGNLTLKEFQILVAEETVEDFKFGRFANFSKSNGEEANIVEIFQLLTNVRIFWYYNGREKYSEQILKEMNSFNSRNTKLLEFLLMLNEVPENFDSNLLFHFIQKNSAPFCQLYLMPFGENKDAVLLKLKAAEEKFKYLKEWKDKNFNRLFPHRSLKDFLPENNEYVCEKRIRQTIENILDKYPGNILIVSHGSPIAAIHKVLGNQIRDIRYCALSHFIVTKADEPFNADFNDDGIYDINAKYNFKCMFAGDMSHLSEKTEVIYPVIHPDKNPEGITPTPMKAPS